MKTAAAVTLRAALLGSAAALLAVAAPPAAGFQIFQPVPAGAGDYIRNALANAQAPFVHWDCRELPQCKVPWSLAFPVPDLDRDGMANQPADQLLARNTFTAAFAAWEGVNNAVIGFQLGDTGAALPAGLAGIALDGYNLVSFAGKAQDDTQCVAVGALAAAPGGNVGRRPFAPTVDPGADRQLVTQPLGDDVILACIVDGGNGLSESTAAGDDVQIAPAPPGVGPPSPVPAGCSVIVTAGANGVLNTVPGGDDRIAFCVVAGPDGRSDTPANNQGTSQGAGSGLGLTGLFFNNVSGVVIESDVEFNNATTWTVNANGAAVPRGSFDLQTVATHEFGHLIGIAHPVDGRNSDDVQAVAVGAAAAAGVAVVTAGADGQLATQPQGDDVLDPATNSIREPAAGGNGRADTTANNAQLNSPAPNNIMNPFVPTSPAMGPQPVANHTLSGDDRAAANFLYTTDHGDAPNPYETLIRNLGGGRMLSGVTLDRVRNGASVLLGADAASALGGGRLARFEWLGANEDGGANECDPRQPNSDAFDDGVTHPVPLQRGRINRFVVTVSHTAEPGRYLAANPQNQLHYNGYLDFPRSNTFLPHLKIWASLVPGQTVRASSNWVTTLHTATRSELSFDVFVPRNAAPEFYCRHRLDYGEDEGRVRRVDPSLAPAVGLAQFGEVEDHRCTAVSPNPPPPYPDQLHLRGPIPNRIPIVPAPGAPPARLFADIQHNFAGVEAQEVIFTALTPNVSFDRMSPGMTGEAYRATSAQGVASVDLTVTSVGSAIVQVTVTDTDLSAYYVFEVVNAAVLGDANGDCTVDFRDLNAVLANFTRAGPINTLAGDLNADGAVNFLDLNIVLAAFGRACE